MVYYALRFQTTFTNYNHILKMGSSRQRQSQLTMGKAVSAKVDSLLFSKRLPLAFFVVMAKHMKVGKWRCLKPSIGNGSSPGL